MLTCVCYTKESAEYTWIDKMKLYSIMVRGCNYYVYQTVWKVAWVSISMHKPKGLQGNCASLSRCQFNKNLLSPLFFQLFFGTFIGWTNCWAWDLIIDIKCLRHSRYLWINHHWIKQLCFSSRSSWQVWIIFQDRCEWIWKNKNNSR